MIRVEYLADHLSCLPTVADWHHTQFSYLAPDTTMEQRLEKLYASAQKEKLPISFVALSGDQLLGSASLLTKTLVLPHLSPWLSSVYVASAHRGKGVGSALTQHVVQAAASLGVEKLYLFTPDRETMYARLGWKRIETLEYRGHSLAVMFIPTK